MKVLPSLLKSLCALLIVVFAGCSSTSNLKNYPRLTDQIAQDMRTGQSAVLENSAYKMPDLSALPLNIAPGNLFSLGHPSDDKLSGRFRVDFEGRLRLPYRVVINVSGKSFSEVKNEVLKSYSKFFQQGVEGVTFTLLRRDYWVEVRGLVKKPGRYLVKESDSLDLVIDSAGGLDGDLANDYFSAAVEQGKFNYKVLLNSYYESDNERTSMRWLGGDEIFVSKIDLMGGESANIPFVTVLGGVVRPGKVLYQSKADLYYFLNKSGGLTPGLGYDECYVFRNSKEGIKKIQFSFDEPATIPVIYPGDTVYMNTDVRTDGDTWLDRLSRIAAIISTAALLIIAL